MALQALVDRAGRDGGAVRVRITALILPGVANFALGGLTLCSDLYVPIRVDRISDVDADVAA